MSKARTVVTKAMQMPIRLGDWIRNPDFPHVPSVVSKQVTDGHATFRMFIEKANIVINSDGKVDASLPDLKDAQFCQHWATNQCWRAVR